MKRVDELWRPRGVKQKSKSGHKRKLWETVLLHNMAKEKKYDILAKTIVKPKTQQHHYFRKGTTAAKQKPHFRNGQKFPKTWLKWSSDISDKYIKKHKENIMKCRTRNKLSHALRRQPRLPGRRFSACETQLCFYTRGCCEDISWDIRTEGRWEEGRPTLGMRGWGMKWLKAALLPAPRAHDMSMQFIHMMWWRRTKRCTWKSKRKGGKERRRVWSLH